AGVDERRVWVIITPGPCDPEGCVTELHATADARVSWSTSYRPTGAMIGVATFADGARGWLTESAAVRRGQHLLGTSDGGGSWQVSVAADTLQPTEAFIGLSAPTPRDVWAVSFDTASCTGDGCERYALRVSRDGGVTWMTVHASTRTRAGGGRRDAVVSWARRSSSIRPTGLSRSVKAPVGDRPRIPAACSSPTTEATRSAAFGWHP